MMKKLCFLFVAFATAACTQARTADSHILRLDSAIASRPAITAAKEKTLADLRWTIGHITNKEEKLRLFEQMYQEYLTYRYDSALVYVQKSLALAQEIGSKTFYQQAVINNALLDARGGFYSEAALRLNSLDADELSDTLKYEYYIAHFWLYMYWSQYSSDEQVKADYWQKMKDFLLEAMKYEKETTVNYLYLMGERMHYIEEDSEKAARYYQKVVDMAPVNSKLYASAAFSLARCYMDKGDINMYEYWLTNSAISDIVTPLKENLSLQELAMYLFEKDNDNVDRATNYIYCSMEDAQFFNNRLRLIELSGRFSTILSAYTKKINTQKTHILYGMIALGLLALLILAAALFIRRQNGQLHRHREELQAKNGQLHEQHEEVKLKNEKLELQRVQLYTLNEQLLDTNLKREGLAKIYIDLCAKYIDRLKKYQTLVRRKIKANQVQELLSTMSSSRISEEDAAAFMNRFDKAFLDLYPTFVDELNALLLPENQLVLRQPGTLSPELRIYALIRLGVRESSEIADLLFFSPQTIYNYRSALKAKAISKDTFDADVKNLCTVISRN